MKVMNLGSEDEPVVKKRSSNRNLKIILGLAAVILVPTIGSTLAGSIVVSNGKVEFGQGVVATAACDSTITVTPATVLTTGVFTLENITVSTVDEACDGKHFTIKVLDSDSALVPIGTSSATFCKILFKKDAGFTATAGVTDTCGTINGATATSFVLTPTTHPLSTAVYSITLESSDT